MGVEARSIMLPVGVDVMFDFVIFSFIFLGVLRSVFFVEAD
jgi:hypothetical protein